MTSGRRIFLYFLGIHFSTLLLLSATSLADEVSWIEPDWSTDAKIPDNGRANPYQLPPETLKATILKGRQHALQYPVTATGLLIPARSALKVLNAQPGDPLFSLMKLVLSLSSDFKDFQGFWDWVGLSPYPTEDHPSANGPIPAPQDSEFPMGVSIVRKSIRGKTVDGMTLSCAACHAGRLFGRPVFGLTARFPRSNLFFIHGQSTLQKISPRTLRVFSKASREEAELYAESRDRIRSVGMKRPQTLGVDTSLAQVALSLAKRAPNATADRDETSIQNPRPNLLDHHVADSKPAVWWNVKYKTRWLSDGSVLSGNPVFTNFLWNEIGRGTDIADLEVWLSQNQTTVRELTAAVFATEAPRYIDFFGEDSIHVTRAKRGSALFQQYCTRCHGEYSLNESIRERPQVRYTQKIRDVGTDPGRYQGMVALAEGLNPLDFSKKKSIMIEPQEGYIAPPLVGIWARFPYLHNNSIPNLCELMKKPSDRVVTYISGEPEDPSRHYDHDCLGYPVGDLTPQEWKKRKHLKDHTFDARLEGLSNAGHYTGIFADEAGSEFMDSNQKQDLIEFLKGL